MGRAEHKFIILCNAVEVDVLEHVEAVVRGFINTYELLLKHRDDLLASDGPLARFTEDEMRVIIRPTRIYAKMLENSFHPDVLRDALDRERLFDRLWVGIEDNPGRAQRSLQRGHSNIHDACRLARSLEQYEGPDSRLFCDLGYDGRSPPGGTAF